MFNPELIEEFKNHALAQFPNEAVAYIQLVGNEPTLFIKENISPNPRFEFEVSAAEYPRDDSLLAIIHSHPSGLAEPTKEDIAHQIASAVPWGIVVLNRELAQDPIWWGPGVQIPPLVGRKFRHGPSGSDGGGDCLALIRDWYLLNRNIILPEFPRTNNWWAEGENMYVDNFHKAGFERIGEDEILPGDVFLAQVGFNSPVPNHGGIYIGGGLALHHLHNRLSKRDPIHRWNKFVTHWLRYTG